MAIAFDASSDSGHVAASSITLAHTCSGSDRVLIVHTAIADTENVITVTGVTYGGVAMTKIGSDAVGTTNARRTNMWILIAPATGANNIVATFSGTPSAWGDVVGVSYTGASQSSQPDATAQQVTAQTTSVSQAVTTIADNCILVGVGLAGSNAITVGANTYARVRSTNDEVVAFENSGPLTPETPPGSFSLAYTSAGAYDLPLIVASLAPVGAVVTAIPRPNLLLMGAG